MNRSLTHGLLGRMNNGLAPSAIALGPNTYLVGRDFLKMLGVAFVVHAMVVLVYALVPREKVTDIPVRALSFKLGSEEKIGAYAPTLVVASMPAPIAPPVVQALSKDSWRATPNVPAPVVPAPLKPIPKIAPVSEAPKPLVKQPRVVKIDDFLSQPDANIAESPMFAPQPAAAVASTPQQYVREVGAPSAQVVAAAMAASPNGSIGGTGETTSLTEQTAQATRARYTQEISAWVQHHMFYPAAAGDHEGRAVVRVRIDRAGNVRYYAIEQSAGLKALDDAALEMIRRANPMPAAPPNYPDSNVIEFLIPLNFRVPQ